MKSALVAVGIISLVVVLGERTPIFFTLIAVLTRSRC